MISEKEFRSSGKRDELYALLNNPTLIEALGIVGEGARPRGGIEPRPNAHLDTLVAQKYHKQAGIQHALDHLRRLALPPDAEAQVEDELESMPFFSSLPHVVQEALRKKLKQHTSPE